MAEDIEDLSLLGFDSAERFLAAPVSHSQHSAAGGEDDATETVDKRSVVLPRADFVQQLRGDMPDAEEKHIPGTQTIW